VTDDEGARLLVDGLGLRFDSVSTTLNHLRGHDPAWWATGKLYAYREQSQPFVHIDSDVFLWKPLPGRLLSAPLCAQNPEYFVTGSSNYQPERIERAIGWEALPEEWRWYRTRGAIQRGISCGIVGGNMFPFIHHYADQAIGLLESERTRDGLQQLARAASTSRLAMDNLNVLLEQYFLSACLEYHQHVGAASFGGISMEFLFSDMTDAFDPARSRESGYTHLIGHAKRGAAISESLERLVRRDYAQQFERCVSAATTHM